MFNYVIRNNYSYFLIISIILIRRIVIRIILRLIIKNNNNYNNNYNSDIKQR